MSISEWPVNIPVVEDGITTFSANDLNPIINSLSARTNWLKDKINNLTGSFGFTFTDSGFDASCKKGMLLAHDPETKKYFPAEAIWSDAVREDGSVAPSWKASVVGILLTDILTSTSDNKAYGSIQVFGCISDNAIIDILAPERVVGSYYLTREGKATNGVENKDLPVFCYTYLSSGKVLLHPKAPEYGGHSHNYCGINNDLWLPAANAESEIPEDSVVVLDISDTGDQSIHELLVANPNHICLVKNGQEVMPSNWGITTDLKYLYLKFNVTATDELSIHAITPLTANEPLVHSIATTNDNNLLAISNIGGNVLVGLNIENIEKNYYSGYGITALDDEGLKTGPVIQGIRAGAGADVKPYRDQEAIVPGIVEISCKQYKNTLIDMNLCNLNQVIIGTSFNGVSYVFPRNVSSSLTGTIRIPNFESGNYQEGELVIMFQGNGQSITGLSADILIQPLPGVNDSEGKSTPSIISHTIQSISGDDTSKCYAVSVPLGGENGQKIHSDGLLICTLKSAGDSEIRVVSVSFRLI